MLYRDFQAQAEIVGDHAAAERFGRLREDERRHREQFLAVLGPWTRPTRPSRGEGQRS